MPGCDVKRPAAGHSAAISGGGACRSRSHSAGLPPCLAGAASAIRQPVPGTLMLAAAGVTVRAVLAAATGSAVVYFLQPTLGTLVVSAAFLCSVPLRRPLIQKLASDMVPLPEAFLAREPVRRFFMRIT